MKNNIDSNFAIAILALVAACIGFAFWFLGASEDINLDSKTSIVAKGSQEKEQPKLIVEEKFIDTKTKEKKVNQPSLQEMVLSEEVKELRFQDRLIAKTRRSDGYNIPILEVDGVEKVLEHNSSSEHPMFISFNEFSTDGRYLIYAETLASGGGTKIYDIEEENLVYEAWVGSQMGFTDDLRFAYICEASGYGSGQVEVVSLPDGLITKIEDGDYEVIRSQCEYSGSEDTLRYSVGRDFDSKPEEKVFRFSSLNTDTALIQKYYDHISSGELEQARLMKGGSPSQQEFNELYAGKVTARPFRISSLSDGSHSFLVYFFGENGDTRKDDYESYERDYYEVIMKVSGGKLYTQKSEVIKKSDI